MGVLFGCLFVCALLDFWWWVGLWVDCFGMVMICYTVITFVVVVLWGLGCLWVCCVIGLTWVGWLMVGLLCLFWVVMLLGFVLLVV